MLKKSLTAIAVACLIISPSLEAAGNSPHWDDGYRIFQDHSPNFVQVEILNVTVSSNKALWFASGSDRVEVEARVLKVIRSKDNLRPGMIIPILYDRKAAAGGTFAETPGIPEKGAILPAFIKLKGNHFIPAARHHTFTPLAEEQLNLLDRDTIELTEAQIAALHLPEDFGTSLQVATSSDLPLVAVDAPEAPVVTPLKEKITEPEINVVSAELPMIDPETPELITPTIPSEPATVEVAIPEIEPPALKAEVVTTPVTVPEMSVNTAEVTTDVSEQPVIDTGSVNLEAKPKRRTVIVIPPSQLRSQRQQKIQSVMESSAQVPPPVTAIKAEVVASDPVVPKLPTLRAKVNSSVVEPAVLPTDPVRTVISNAEQTTSTAAQYPVLRAEPVEVAVPESNMTTTPSTIDIEAKPVVPLITPPSIPNPPREEPVTITDFTPKVPAIPSNPPASPLDLTASDRTNMKSYADIYLSLQEANSAATKKDYDQAKTLYQKSLEELQALKSANPDFQPFMVEYRIRDTTRKLEQLVLKAPKATTP